MDATELLAQITDYCRSVGLAESTFGKLAVNDGKFVNRLRDGGRITTHTLDRIRGFISANPAPADGPGRPFVVKPRRAPEGAPAVVEAPGTEKDFRFYDNRQKYLLFVNTCSEKWVVADRVTEELVSLRPRPPALRLFDAGVGDGTVLTRVMRAMHNRFSTVPFYIVGKEISIEDVRLALEKMPDRFYEHGATVLVLTNLNYMDAPWLVPQSLTAATSLVWKEVALKGSTAHEFEEQITALQPGLAEQWRTRVSPTSGNPVPERPSVVVIYREDHRFMLDEVIPKQGGTRADYDLVMASQPYRARASLEFKANKVLTPLARSLGPGGRLLAIHSHGNDPGHEILQGIWPNENPFIHDRHQLLKAVKANLGAEARNLNFNAYSDARSLFRYQMHALPSEVSQSIGTSTLFAAWNAAIYVGQIEDARLESVLGDRRYLEVTREVLKKHNGLWFWDESFVVTRRPE
jgi:hypothetical protein